MRVPLAWLREYVDLEWDADELARRLTLLGMEVQGIEQIGADWQQVVVGRLEMRKLVETHLEEI